MLSTSCADALLLDPVVVVVIVVVTLVSCSPFSHPKHSGADILQDDGYDSDCIAVSVADVVVVAVCPSFFFALLSQQQQQQTTAWDVCCCYCCCCYSFCGLFFRQQGGESTVFQSLFVFHAVHDATYYFLLERVSLGPW